MKVRITQNEPVEDMLDRDLRRMERSHTRAMRSVATSMKAAWRDEIRAGGLGNRVANTVRSASYPQGQDSLNAAAMIWTKAPDIVSAHDAGTLVKSPDGFWLAIPLPSAGRGRGGRRMTPGDYEKRTGQKLRFVYRKGRSALLVADEARISAAGQARRKGGRRRKDGVLTGAQTVPVFVLVPQVKLRKRTDLIPAAEAVVSRIPEMMSDWARD